jgi:hypothetical protein
MNILFYLYPKELPYEVQLNELWSVDSQLWSIIRNLN